MAQDYRRDYGDGGRFGREEDFRRRQGYQGFYSQDYGGGDEEGGWREERGGRDRQSFWGRGEDRDPGYGGRTGERYGQRYGGQSGWRQGGWGQDEERGSGQGGGWGQGQYGQGGYGQGGQSWGQGPRIQGQSGYGGGYGGMQQGGGRAGYGGYGQSAGYGQMGGGYGGGFSGYGQTGGGQTGGGYTGQTGSGYGSTMGGQGMQGYRQGGEDRDFWERGSDEVRSWFGDDDAQRRRRMDEMRSHRGRGPEGYTRSDDRIREDVNDRLTDDPMLDATRIRVQVQNGEVTLTGAVEDRFDKRRAEDCAESCQGVKHVQNNLRVESREQGMQTMAGSSGAGTSGGRTMQSEDGDSKGGRKSH